MFFSSGEGRQSASEALRRVEGDREDDRAPPRTRWERLEANNEDSDVRFKELIAHINDSLSGISRDVILLTRQHEVQLANAKSQLKHFLDMQTSRSGGSREDLYSTNTFEPLRSGPGRNSGMHAECSSTRSASKLEATMHPHLSTGAGERQVPRSGRREDNPDRPPQYYRSRTQSSVMAALPTSTTVTSEKRVLRLEAMDQDSEEEKQRNEEESAEDKKMPLASPSTGRKRLARREGFGRELRTSSARHAVTGGTRQLRRMSSEATLLDALIVSRPTRGFAAMGPDSLLRRCLDVIGVLCTLIDIVTVPIMVAWEAYDELALLLPRWIVRMYWTLDVPCSFLTAVRSKDHKLEVRLRKTVFLYLRGWFAYDAIVVTCDWLALSRARWVRRVALHAIVFVLRLVRQLPRFGPKCGNLILALKRQSTRSSSFELLVDVLWIVSSIIIFNHLITCVWYIIGSHSKMNDTGDTWLTQREMLDKTPEYEYFTGMHWALTQMTPGSMEIFPASTIERVYNIVVLIFGLIVGTGLTATLTSRMTQHRLGIEVRTKRFAQLEQYLAQEQVTRSLAMLIKADVQARYRERPRIKMKDVHDLSLVSTNLREELTFHIYATTLSTFPLFQLIDTIDQNFMGGLCSKVILVMDLNPGDILFQEAEPGNALFFVTHGLLQYFPGHLCPEVAWPLTDKRLLLGQQHWCSEPALWTIWLYLGTMQAAFTSEVLSVSADALQAELAHHPIVEDIVGDYCRAFHLYYKSSFVHWSDLGTGLDHNDVLSGMSRHARLALAEPILIQRFRRADKIANQLREELMTGACYLCIQNNEVLRTVLAVSLRLRRESEEDVYLVQVGEIKGSAVSAECTFPGTKRREQETSSDAMKRFVQTYLSSVASGIQLQVDHTESNFYIKDSPRYGLRTRYLRTTFNGILSDSSHLEVLAVTPQLPSLRLEEEMPVAEAGPKRCLGCCLRRSWKSEDSASTSATVFKLNFGKTKARQPVLAKRRSSYFFDEPAHSERPVSRKLACEAVESVLLSKDEAVIVRDQRSNVLVFLWLTEEEHNALTNTHAQRFLERYVECVAEQLRAPPRVSSL